MKQFRSEYWLHGVCVRVILVLNCSDSLIANSLNLQICSGWRSCGVEVFTLKCMSSVQQEKYLVQIKCFNYSLPGAWWNWDTIPSETCRTQLDLTHSKHFIMAAYYYYKVDVLYLWPWFIKDSLKFRNNFLKNSILFLNIFPTFLGLAFTTAKVRIKS